VRFTLVISAIFAVDPVQLIPAMLLLIAEWCVSWFGLFSTSAALNSLCRSADSVTVVSTLAAMGIRWLDGGTSTTHPEVSSFWLCTWCVSLVLVATFTAVRSGCAFFEQENSLSFVSREIEF
jgi:hypothetical protein